MNHAAASAHPFDAVRHRTRFFFIRHGQSEGNQQGRIQGHSDMGLTDKGRQQALAAGRWLVSQGIEKIYASPLSRALETARLIASECSIEPASIIQCNDLKELDTGIFSGKNFNEIREEHGEAWRAFRQRSWEAVPGAEKIKDLTTRALGHWQRLISESPERPSAILSVTHGGFMQWLFRSSFSPNWQRWMPLVDTANCGIFELLVEPVEEAGDATNDRIYAEWLRVNFVAPGSP